MEIEFWLNYHFDLGVRRIFLRVEDSPEVLDKVRSLSAERRSRVHTLLADSSDGAQSQWWSLQRRQADFCRLVKARCLDQYDDVTWILQNLDDDELLYCPGGNIERFLKGVPSDKRAIFVQTVEGLYPDANKDDRRCFRTDTFVKCDHRSLCTSYYGGKSFGLLTEDLEPHGPHEFRGAGWSGKQARECYKPNVEEVAILHYESCNFSRWKDKFANLRVSKGGRAIPNGFRFYNESIEMARRDDDEALEYYKSVKVAPYAKYAPLKRFDSGPYIV